MVVWDNSFEDSPANSDAANQGANEIRTLKEAINERFELEMNFREGTKPFIKAGIASVIKAANTATINALAANASNGALAFDTQTGDLKYANAAAWNVAQLNHANFANLTSGDPHTQYLPKAGGTMSGNITMGSGKTVDGVDIDAFYTLYGITAAAYVAHAANKVAHANTFGTWDTANYTINTNETAPTDGIVVAYANTTHLYIESPIGTTRVYATGASGVYLSLVCPVRKGDTFKVSATSPGSNNVHFLPIGS